LVNLNTITNLKIMVKQKHREKAMIYFIKTPPSFPGEI